MLPDELREYCLSKNSATEDQPFGPDVLVFKVLGKMFATLSFDNADGQGRCNLKCDPERAIELRGTHESILPGYHMNKRHWNTLLLDGSLPTALVGELVDHSWQLVAAGLPKRDREAIME